MSKIVNLYEDKNKINKIYPRTTADAVLSSTGSYPLLNYIEIIINKTDWVKTKYKSDDCYSTTKVLEGSSLDNSHPYINLLITSLATAESEIKEYGKIYFANAGNNNITFYAADLPESNLTIQVKGW